MKVRLGFFCSTSDGKLSTNHKFALKNLSRETVLKTVRRNLEDFEKLLELSKRMGLGIFRLGSNVVPFASHPAFETAWLDEVKPLLRDFAVVVKGYGIRITMHPGQFVVLNSSRPDVVQSSLRELRYHFWVLENLDVGAEGVVVVHVGGTYQDKASSIRKFLDVVHTEPWLLERLAVENDERSYTVADLLVVSSEGIPIVLDHYHHRLNPSEFEPSQVISSWRGLTPEFHLSSAPEHPARFGEHGEWIKPGDFRDLVETFHGQSFDVIVEAKAKEKAIERLLRDLDPSHISPAEVRDN